MYILSVYGIPPKLLCTLLFLLAKMESALPFHTALPHRSLGPLQWIVDWRLSASEDEEVIQETTDEGTTHSTGPGPVKPVWISEELAAIAQGKQGETRTEVPGGVKRSTSLVTKSEAETGDDQANNE